MQKFLTGCLVGLVVVITYGQPSAQVPPNSSPALSPPNAAGDLLDIYGELTGRTVLMSGGLPKLNATLTPELLGDTNRAAAFIEAEFAKHGIEAVPDGGKFVHLLRVGWSNSPLAAPLARIQPPRAGGEQIPAGSVNWSAADLNLVLATYSDLTGTTVLHPSNLACTPIRFRSQTSLTREELIYAIKVLLALNGIAVIDDGQTFTQVVPSVQAPQVQSRAPNRETLAGQSARIQPSRPAGEEFPGGYINWSAADLDQVLAFYSDITHRTILRNASLASPPIVFKNHDALTREELIYAIKVLLAFNSVAVIDDGDKFTQVVPLAQAPQIQTRAPKPEKGATLIDPTDVPAFKFATPPSVKLPPELRNLPKSPREPREPTVDSLVAFYAKLTDAKPIPSKQFGHHPVLFEIKNPVTKAELLYAIEATLAQSGFVVVPAEKNSIQVVHFSELHKAKTNSPALLKR